MRPSLVLPSAVKSFHDYYNLNAPTDEVAEALGYRLVLAHTTLPTTDAPLLWVADLVQRLEEIRPRVTFTIEAARRELLIAPVLMELLRHVQARLRIEYAIEASERLRGDLDYLLIAEHRLLVVEAKNADTERGMTQLVAELAALDAWSDSEEAVLYGALSTGTLWHFAVLDRAAKTITQDLQLFRVPDDLEPLARVLVGILDTSP